MNPSYEPLTPEDIGRAIELYRGEHAAAGTPKTLEQIAKDFGISLSTANDALAAWKRTLS